jgi:hypothetical protein
MSSPPALSQICPSHVACEDDPDDLDERHIEEYSGVSNELLDLGTHATDHEFTVTHVALPMPPSHE